MQQIIFKKTLEGNWCLFDTKTDQFFDGGCVRCVEKSYETLGLANSIAAKPPKAILEIAQAAIYSDDYGYLPYMIASSLIKFDPTIKERVLEKLKKPKMNNKLTRKTKIRTRKTVKPVKAEAQPVDGEAPKRKRGRPPKVIKND
jgi:hypothetical protein